MRKRYPKKHCPRCGKLVMICITARSSAPGETRTHSCPHGLECYDGGYCEKCEKASEENKKEPVRGAESMEAYSYKSQKQRLFTDDGQRLFLKVRDAANELLRKAGAFKLGAIVPDAITYDTWDLIACVDRMVEIRELKEITATGAVAGQDRVFVSARG